MVSRKVIYRVAYRYFVSKKSHSVINLISWVTVAAIATPVAAMIILLSVHNGFEELISKLWGGYGAPLIVERRDGGVIVEKSFPVDALQNIEGVAGVSGYTDNEFLLRYKGRQVAVRALGVDSIYISATNLHKAISHGRGSVSEGPVVGIGIAYTLGLRVNLSEPFNIIAPQSEGFRLFSEGYYRESSVALNGVFTIDASRDSELIFLDKRDVFTLTGCDGEVAAMAVSLGNEADIERVRDEISNAITNEYIVKNLLEQNELEYRMVQSEKLAIYMIIMLITIVASLTIVGTMLMLIMEKRGSSRNLFILGFSNEDIRGVFFALGGLLSSVGVAIGSIIGIGVVIAQQLFSFVPLYGGGLLVDSYPVLLLGGDVVLVILSVMAVALILVFLSCRFAFKGKRMI